MKEGIVLGSVTSTIKHPSLMGKKLLVVQLLDAKGNPKEHSDIDLAIISDSFLDKPHIKNMQFLSRIAAYYNSLIEALPFTLQEYKNLDHRTLLAGIVRSGRRFPVKAKKGVQAKKNG